MKYYLLIILAFVLITLTGCGNNTSGDERPLVVTSTMMLEDAVKVIAGDSLRVVGLMGPGVDPHLYRATPRDISSLDRADLIIYNGLFLEARLAEIFEKMDERTHAAAESIPQNRLIDAFEYGGNFDPHVWFDVSLWSIVVEDISQKLQGEFPDLAPHFQKNTDAYLAELEELHTWVTQQINSIPESKQVLITAHDAFSYFGKAYGMEVKGLQGLSTQSEFGIQDVTRMVAVIIEQDIPAIFLETSIAPRSIQSLINGVKERGGSVVLGGELYSDAMGERGTPESTYLGMVRHNVTTITNALKGNHE